MTKDIQSYVDGKRVIARKGRSASVFDPATGKESGIVCFSDTFLTDEAIASAMKAAYGWGETSPLHRSRILNRFLRIVEDRIDQLAKIITSEQGKTFSDAKGEIQRGLEVVEFAIGAHTY